MIPHVDQARDYLIQHLANLPAARGNYHNNNQVRTHGCDIWIPNVVADYYQMTQQMRILDNWEEERYIPFYDAAWELSRIGVLRPASVAALGMGMGSGFHGDGYSLTEFGKTWVKAAKDNLPPPTDPSRYMALLSGFENKLGQAFKQRAAEAAHCHTTTNYLACCVMAGAAAESILLAAAITKTNDESKVLSEYRGASGRTRVTNMLIGAAPKGIADPLKAGLNLLSYWRDEAGHGQASTINEIEAFSALTQLLRLAQFTVDNWDTITAP